jgi:alpha-galactosidase
MAEKYAEVDPLEFEETACDRRSVEYCSWIMEAVATGRPFRFMGNVYNDGYIDNLPRDSAVEVPTFADDTGLRPTRVGKLPPQCAAACMTNVNVQQLTADAALTGDPEHIVHALALDPLTAAVCTLKEIRDMASEMLEAERAWLPEFAGRSIRATPTISIPPGLKPVEVPLDPALAIHQRFGKLVSQKTD